MKNMKLLLLLGIVLLSVLANACGPYYKEGIIKGRILQDDHIADVAKGSSDIFDFAYKIYAKLHTKPVADDFVVLHKYASERGFGNILRFEDSRIFKMYCSGKGGEGYLWHIDRDWYAYSGFNGISKTFYTCEIDKKVDAAIVVEEYEASGRLRYEQVWSLVNKKFFDELQSKYKLLGFTSSNKVLTIPLTMVDDPKAKTRGSSGTYSAIFSFKNESKSPVVIDMLNSTVLINSAKYTINFNQQGQPIYWQSYSNSNGIFVGDEGKRLSKLQFNPEQSVSGQVVFEIPGATSIKADDLVNITFLIDTIKCTDFRKTSYYELQKKKI